MKLVPPYNFGISQEDATTEAKALMIDSNDHLLCICSGGEVPLNLLARYNINIVACDTSIEQIYLTKLKLKALLELEQKDASFLIGFKPCDKERRIKLFRSIEEKLSLEERTFWNNNLVSIESGIINTGKFERYIKRFNWVLRLLLGNRNLRKLMLLNSIEEQQTYFDKHMSNFLVRGLFKIAFHPKIYKNRGMDEHGLQHQKDASVSEFFYNRFRDFCTATLAHQNYYFQYTFFNKILDDRGYPAYLTTEGIENIRKHANNISFVNKDFSTTLKSYPNGTFNAIHLSNIGDWLSIKEMDQVYKLIHEYVADSTNIIYRYIHKKHHIPASLQDSFHINDELGKQLLSVDKYPFYRILPISFNRKNK